MQTRFIADGDLVEISNARGKIILPAVRSDSLQAGHVFIPMHWGQEFTGGHHVNQDQSVTAHLGVNALTTSAFDAISKQPELKLAHVRINKLHLVWRFLGVAWINESELLQVQQNLRQFYTDFSFASCTLFGRGEQAGIVFRGAHTESIAAHRLQELILSLQIDTHDSLRYEDKARSASRLIRLQQNEAKRTMRGYALTGDISAESWLNPLLQQQTHVTRSAELLQRYAPTAQTTSVPSNIVCSCLNVSRQQIESELSDTAQLQAQLPMMEKFKLLQNKLRCGTNCGSCVPEVKQLIRSHV